MTLASRDLLAVWRTLDLDDARAATDVLLPAARDLVAGYGEIAAGAAADFYDVARVERGVPGRFTAMPAAPAAAEQVDALTRWSVTPLWSQDPRYGKALERLAGEVGKLIRQAGHDTVVESTKQDREARGWQRFTSPGACKFCRMLADRGAVYSAETARFASHPNCGCTAAPTWDPGREASVLQYQASARSRTPEERAALRRYLDTHFPDAPG